MSVANIVQLYRHSNPTSVKTMLWVMSKIDYNKLLRRVTYAYEHPDETVKCVLLEYDYTSWSYVRQGNANVIERMPNSNVLVHHALHTPDFVQLMDYFLTNNHPGMTVYARQKINSDGSPNFHRKQLVLMFEPYTFVAPPLPSSPPSERTILNPEEECQVETESMDE
jgi:hypothetical protein